jgi:hypothetical protein
MTEPRDRCVPLTDAWCRMAIATRVITPPPGEGQRSHAGILLVGAFIALIVVVPWVLWVGGK